MKFFSLTGSDGEIERALRVISEKGKTGVIRASDERFSVRFDDISMDMPAELKKSLDILAFFGADYVVFVGNVEGVKSIQANDPELSEKIESLEDYETLPSLIKKIKENSDIMKVGAIGTFTGVVREIEDGERVLYLEFESYDKVAKKKLSEIEEELRQRKGIVDVKIFHKTGRVMAGEDIVHVVVAGSHRKEVWSALIDSMELIKKLVPIWKKEVLETGERWVHEKNR